MKYKQIIDELRQNRTLSDDDFLELINCTDAQASEYLRAQGREVALSQFGNAIYMRGLIEFTNYCKNDCFYCGIRKSNLKAERYRLTKQQVLSCCESGYALGFRTFVMQGGEDAGFSDDALVDILETVKGRYPDCAITLSFGEKSREVYARYKAAGADRYLLRHETADAEHYGRLHPEGQDLQSRVECLYALKELGFQVGVGFMVGSPYQTPQTILKDLRFIEGFKPQMIGVGPFLPHRDTPFCDMPKGSLELSVNLLAMLRLMIPNALIPSTTALGTIDKNGREMGILAGANVVMPNLSPIEVRSKYLLYNDKIATGEEAAESKNRLAAKVGAIGYELAVTRGDFSAEKNA